MGGLHRGEIGNLHLAIERRASLVGEDDLDRTGSSDNTGALADLADGDIGGKASTGVPVIRGRIVGHPDTRWKYCASPFRKVGWRDNGIDATNFRKHQGSFVICLAQQYSVLAIIEFS